MKPKALFTLIAALSMLISAELHARSIKMIFWYPGEAGTTEEAQPIIDEFFEYLNDKIAPDRIGGKYFNTVEGGMGYLQKEKPAVGIISYAAWAQNRGKLGGAEVILATLPLPHGQKTESYALVGSTTKIPTGATVLSSEPLSAAFVRVELFPDLPADAKLEPTPQLLMKLKEIGEGRLSAAAILTPTEAATLAKLTQPWAKSLKVIAESKPVPTARVIIFDKGWNDVSRFRAALLSIGGDPNAREILDEMRLKGFAPE